MTPGIVKAATKGVDCANAHRLTVEFLEKLSDLEPQWQGPVKELRSQLDHLHDVCQGTLALSEQFASRQ